MKSHKKIVFLTAVVTAVGTMLCPTAAYAQNPQQGQAQAELYAATALDSNAHGALNSARSAAVALDNDIATLLGQDMTGMPNATYQDLVTAIQGALDQLDLAKGDLDSAGTFLVGADTSLALASAEYAAGDGGDCISDSSACMNACDSALGKVSDANGSLGTGWDYYSGALNVYNTWKSGR